jgi:hypothetical protein
MFAQVVDGSPQTDHDSLLKCHDESATNGAEVPSL